MQRLLGRIVDTLVAGINGRDDLGNDISGYPGECLQ
jgi:hypothetical protein